MRVSSHPGLLFRSVTAMAFLAGCLAGGSQTPAATTPSLAGAQIGAADGQGAAKQVIVSDSSANVVSVFDAEGRLQRRLRKGINYPFGITTDLAGNLYVANTGASNVLVYAQPYNVVTFTLALPNQSPTDVAVSTTGIVGVMSSTLPSG